MLQRQVQRKQKSFALQRGLYVVRYDTAADLSQPPLVTFTCTPGVNEVIAPPEQAAPTMSAPGQALVIRAMDTGHVQVEISSVGTLGVLDATLKFEQLRGDPNVTAVAGQAQPGGWAGQALPPLPPLGGPQVGGFGGPAMAPAIPAAMPPQRQPVLQAAMPANTAAVSPDLQVLGHLARVGDVTVASNQWLGGPSAPTRIEGLMLKWPGKPAGLGLRYSTTVAGQKPSEVRAVELGEYSGTRGRGRPVLGFSIELSGPLASQYSLVAEVVFLGSPARRIAGPSIAATGPTGREPLVGLRLGIVGQAVDRPAQQRPVSAPLQPPVAGHAQPVYAPATAGSAAPADPSRVRVFRA